MKVPSIKDAILTLLRPKLFISWIAVIAISMPFIAFRIYGIYGWGSTIAAFFAFLALLVSMVAPRVKYSIAELAILFATASIITDVALWGGFWPYCGMAFAPIYGGPNWPKIKDIVPTWIFPPEDVLNLARKGGQAFPLAQWIPTLTFLTFTMMFSLLFHLSVATFWAYRWISVERLPFPAVMVNVWFMRLYSETVEVEGKKKCTLLSKKSLWFWVGFIIAFIIEALALMEAYTEYYWRITTGKRRVYISFPASTGFIGQFVVDLRFLSPYLPGANLYWYPGLDLGWLALNLFMPIDVLATAVIWFIFWSIIWPPIVNHTGLVGMKVSHGWLGWNKDSPFPFYRVSNEGMIVGFGVALLVFNWKYIRDILSSAVGRRTALAKELEAKGISPSWIVALCAISGLGLIAMWTAFGAPIAFLIPWVFIVWIWLSGHARAVSEAGWVVVDAPTLGNYGYALARTMFGWPNQLFSREVVGVWWASKHFAWPSAWREVPGIGAWGHVLSYRMAEEAKLNWRVMLIVQVITIIVVSIVMWPVVYGILYFKGSDVPWNGYVTRYFITRAARIFADNSAVGTIKPRKVWILEQPSSTAWTFIGGPLIVLLLTFLRLRFPWFFLNPAGIALAGSGFVWLAGTTMIALVLKLIVVKIGGAAAYEKYIAPFAAGWGIGYGLAGIPAYWPEQIYRALYNAVFPWFWW